jgi:hypothetical protein
MTTSCVLSPIVLVLLVLLLGLLCYAAFELIRALTSLRIMLNRIERVSDLSRIFDWFRNRR